jgi:hypothetical protein
LWRQGCGRVMRSAEGKRDAVILDHAANAHRFGSPNDADDYSLKDQRPDGHGGGGGRGEAENCPACHRRLERPVPMTCPECQHVLREERAVAITRAELDLQELSPADEADRWEWYQECVGAAIGMNKKLGWCWFRYKDRWGEPPPAWMPVKAHIYRHIYHRDPPPRLVEIAQRKGNRQEVMA